jgi:predicted metal-dependent RNase
VFLVHGESDQQTGFAAAIQAQYRVEVAVPERGESFDLL